MVKSASTSVAESSGLFPCVTESAVETQQVGEQFAAFVSSGDVIALTGPIGSGKTQFIKGFCRRLGIDESTVTSPTFSIAHEYDGRHRIVHLDLYRLESEEEAARLGFEEYLSQESIALIEWPYVAARLLPPDTIGLSFEHLGDDRRRIGISKSEISKHPGSGLKNDLDIYGS